MTMAVDMIMVKVRTTIQRQTKFDESYIEKIRGSKVIELWWIRKHSSLIL